MLIGTSGKVFTISAELSETDLMMVKCYIQGAVHSFTKNAPGQSFAVRDLFGGENGDWNGSPLQKLYDYHRQSKTHKKATAQAAKDAGWLLKEVLSQEENRYYEQFQGGKTKRYRRIDRIPSP